jgi:hypothetical protein
MTTLKRTLATFVVVGAALWAVPTAAQVSVNINVAPPPVIFHAPPRVVVVPKTPVYYAPDTTYNVFVYDRAYWSFHDGAWFHAASHRGPWAFVPVERVPRPVLAVPVRYYKVPPGHARGADGESHPRGKGHGGCPPGHARQGKC